MEVKALRTTEVSKDKAIKEVMGNITNDITSIFFAIQLHCYLSFCYIFQLKNEVEKLDEKLSVTENLVEHKVC